MNPTIVNNLKSEYKSAQLFYLTADVEVSASSDELKMILNHLMEKTAKRFNPESIRNDASIANSREAFRLLGRDPNRYLISSEALIKRCVQGKGLYYINNVIEINNYLSIKTGLSFGSYNMENIVGQIMFKKGQQNETLEGIGKGVIPLENLPILVDTISPFGSPTSDGRRCLIDTTCTRILMVCYCFTDNFNPSEMFSEAKNLLERFASAQNINQFTI